MTVKKKEPVKPVTKPYLPGSVTDENTLKKVLKFFGTMALIVVMCFIVCTMMSFGNSFLRIAANLAVVVLVMFILYSQGQSHGAEATARGEILYQRKEKGQEVSEGEQRLSYHPLKGYVTALLGMAYYYDRNESVTESNTDKMIARAKILVGEQLTTIEPRSLADQLCVSYSSFRRTFKVYTGFSPAKYILHAKITQAKELLTNSSTEIKEIAFNLGFENTDYFFTAFRRLTGQTPLAYRTETQGRKL